MKRIAVVSIITATAALGVAGRAYGQTRLGIAAGAAFAEGDFGASTDPAFAPSLLAHWLMPKWKLAVGVAATYQMYHATGTEYANGSPAADVSIVNGGVNAQYYPVGWNDRTRGYVGLEIDYAHLSVGQIPGRADSPSSPGYFVAPNGGVRVALTDQFEFDLNIRYAFTNAIHSLNYGEHSVRIIHGGQMSFGIAYTFGAPGPKVAAASGRKLAAAGR